VGDYSICLSLRVLSLGQESGSGRGRILNDFRPLSDHVKITLNKEIMHGVNYPQSAENFL